MKEPGRAAKVRAAATEGAKAGVRHGTAAGNELGRLGRAALKTEMGKKAATAAAAEGLVGAALPFVTIVGGAALAGGAMLLWRTFKDKD